MVFLIGKAIKFELRSSFACKVKYPFACNKYLFEFYFCFWDDQPRSLTRPITLFYNKLFIHGLSWKDTKLALSVRLSFFHKLFRALFQYFLSDQCGEMPCTRSIILPCLNLNKSYWPLLFCLMLLLRAISQI